MSLADILTDRAHQMADASPPPLPREILDNILEKLQDASVQVDVEAPVLLPLSALPHDVALALINYREAAAEVSRLGLIAEETFKRHGGTSQEYRRAQHRHAMAAMKSETEACGIAMAMDRAIERGIR